MPLLPPKPLERVCKRKGVAPTVNEATTPESDQASVTPADNFLFEVNVLSDSVKNKEVETLNSMFFDKTSKEWKFRDSNMMPLPVEIEVHKPTLRNLTPKYKRELHRVIEKNAPPGITCGNPQLLKFSKFYCPNFRTTNFKVWTVLSTEDIVVVVYKCSLSYLVQ